MNPDYPHPLIAREGWPFIGALLVVSVLVHLVGGFEWAWPFWLLTVFLVQFFRDPARDVPGAADAVLAPADGRVIVVEQARDPYADRDALKVSIFMNVFNVHVNRAPHSGRVERIEYQAGKFLSADLDKASADNERNSVLIRTKEGKAFLTIQIAGLIARRIVCWVGEGMEVVRGQRFGLICFGSRLEVVLPLESKILVQAGQKVRAGETPLGVL